MSAEPKQAKEQPVDKIKVGGVQIAIWRHEGEKGPYFKAGEPELSYRDKDGAWKKSKSYGLRDLRNLTKASCLADSAILKLNKAHKAAPPAEETPDDGE